MPSSIGLAGEEEIEKMTAPQAPRLEAPIDQRDLTWMTRSYRSMRQIKIETIGGKTGSSRWRHLSDWLLWSEISLSGGIRSESPTSTISSLQPMMEVMSDMEHFHQAARFQLVNNHYHNQASTGR